MPLLVIDGLQVFQFDLFKNASLIHGIYGRQGGVSPAPWESLNLGGTVGDERAHVIENRRRIFASAGLPVESIYDAWQVHSAHVIHVTRPRPLDAPHEKGDAIVTDRMGITLFMRFADCVPIFLADPVKRVIAIAHAGWRGTVDRVAAATVEQMKNHYGCVPGDIRAGIGPSICADHYQVGEEVIGAARGSFGGRATEVLKSYPDGLHLDLWEANRLILNEAGVRQVETAGLCTFEDTRSWFSHRAEHGKTGRFSALLALKET